MLDMFWMVWNPQGHQPTYKHETSEAARREAERLARLHEGQEFYVLRMEARCVVNTVKWEESEYVPF